MLASLIRFAPHFKGRQTPSFLPACPVLLLIQNLSLIHSFPHPSSPMSCPYPYPCPCPCPCHTALTPYHTMPHARGRAGFFGFLGFWASGLWGLEPHRGSFAIGYRRVYVLNWLCAGPHPISPARYYYLTCMAPSSPSPQPQD